jgi:signal-transduction protein with cAMP-binding, CBS, and nucleotidyltransferase domain
MTTVADILRAKGSAEVHHVGPEDSMLEALQRMAEYRIGALMVLEGDRSSRIAGIVTERDYARKIVLQGRNSATTPVREVMTAAVHCVDMAQTCEECMALMTRERIRHLPVLDDQKMLAGIVSIGDLVKAIISEQQFTIEQLEHYISGHRG